MVSQELCGVRQCVRMCECPFILSRLSKSLDDFAAQIMQIKGSSAGDALVVESATIEVGVS